MKIRVSMQGKKRGEDPVGQVCPDRNCWYRALVKGGKPGWETFEQRVPYSASAWFSWKAVSSQQWKNQALQLLTCSSLDPQVHLTCSPTVFLVLSEFSQMSPTHGIVRAFSWSQHCLLQWELLTKFNQDVLS